jgi:DNA-directed RNA polymerase specialized sigma24 family protein
MDETQLSDLAKATKALLLVQLQAQASPDEHEKPEVLLARAGFNAREIADLLGRKHGAIRKSIQRAGV